MTIPYNWDVLWQAVASSYFGSTLGRSLYGFKNGLMTSIECY